MHMASKKMLVVLWLFLWGVAAQAASFDCGKASSPVEKMICADEDLSKWDEALARVYKQVLEKRGNDQEMVVSQRGWLRDVRNQCQSVECVTQVYKERYTKLRELLVSLTVSVCGDPDDKFVRDVCSNDDIRANLQRAVPEIAPGKSVSDWLGEISADCAGKAGDWARQVCVSGELLFGWLGLVGHADTVRLYDKDKERLSCNAFAKSLKTQLLSPGSRYQDLVLGADEPRWVAPMLMDTPVLVDVFKRAGIELPSKDLWPPPLEKGSEVYLFGSERKGRIGFGANLGTLYCDFVSAGAVTDSGQKFAFLRDGRGRENDQASYYLGGGQEMDACMSSGIGFYQHEGAFFAVNHVKQLSGLDFNVYSLGDERFEELCSIRGRQQVQYSFAVDKCEGDAQVCGFVRGKLHQLIKYFDKTDWQASWSAAQHMLLPGAVKGERFESYVPGEYEEAQLKFPELKKIGFVSSKYSFDKPQQFFMFKGEPFVLNITEGGEQFGGYAFRLYKLKASVAGEDEVGYSLQGYFGLKRELVPPVSINISYPK